MALFQKTDKNNGEHWLTISDLMSGLMIVFLFIAVAFMQRTQSIAVAYQENQEAIYNALNEEFKEDLDDWVASIDQRSLSFQFHSPDVLFDAGESETTAKFKSILSNFVPRYLTVLEKYKSSIDEIRIEGHTSSEWRYNTTADRAYFENMALSQGRTRSVLQYAYSLRQLSAEQKEWVKSSFAAVGFSSSKLVLDGEGQEDKERSRRVTFRIITNADAQIREIAAGMYR